MSFDLPKPGVDDVQRTLSLRVPRLAGEDVQLLGEGWAFWAFRAGDTVLRFPKDPEFTATLAVEAAVVHELAPTLPLPVSAIEVHEGGPNGLPFTIHHLVPGVCIRDLRRPLAPGAGATLGRFLRALHAFPVKRAAALGLQPATAADLLLSRRRFFEEQVVPRVFPLVLEPARDHLTTTFTAFLNDPANLRRQPRLTHADIDDNNVLADPDTGDLIGVIDWGDIHIGDPAGDFTAVLYGDIGNAGMRDQLPELLDACGMTEADLDLMRPRCRFGAYCWPLYEVLYGLDTRDEAFTQRGIQYLYGTIESYGTRA